MIPHAYFEKVKQHFNGDTSKTWAWFQTINNIYGQSPINLLKLKQDNKVKNLIHELTINGR